MLLVVNREQAAMPTGSPRIELTGKRFGRWTVTGFAYRTEERRHYWACVCDCGAEKAVLSDVLRNGKSRSCGCLHKEVVSARKTTHGMMRHPAYSSWHAMRQRCGNPKAEGYEMYGGRGIGVCPQWSKFETFWLDMGPTWKPGLSIERIANDRGYSPANCRWATSREQGANRRDNVIIQTPKGPMMMADAAREFGIPRNTINARIRYGWPEADLFLPVTKDNSRRQDNIMVSTPSGPMIAAHAARKYGIGVSTLFARIRAGWPDTDLLRPARSKH
jgi:hypothetical protein